jgi:hypothetical protein
MITIDNNLNSNTANKNHNLLILRANTLIAYSNSTQKKYSKPPNPIQYSIFKSQNCTQCATTTGKNSLLTPSPFTLLPHCILHTAYCIRQMTN